MKTVDVNFEVQPSTAIDALVCAQESSPCVAILLCSYNGEEFLAEQLDSIFAQGHKNIVIWISDDGSIDSTGDVLKHYQALFGSDKFFILGGPQKGFVLNFLSLTYHSDIQADYYAFADQDDIWEGDKLSRAIKSLESTPSDNPALYCSRTRLVDENGTEIGFSPLFKKTPSFANALVQSIGGGNTMVMNRGAINLLRRVSECTVVSHDWWAYMLISGAGGKVFYDSFPTVRYRQHSKNIVGSNDGWCSRLMRLSMLRRGRFRDWNSINIAALRNADDLLTLENKKIFARFSASREAWLLPRLWGVLKSGVYRQTAMGNIGLVVAAIFMKI